jgi:uncharacterized protein (DUF433 family)
MSSDWIEIHPDVCNGRPVLRGTRIAVQSVLEMLAAGDSVDDVMEAFPSLRREQVLACVDHAARLMGNQYSFEPVALNPRLPRTSSSTCIGIASKR